MALYQPAGQPGPAGPPPRASAARSRLHWLLAVIVIMVLLTAGWPLINAAVSDRHSLQAGTRLSVGPGHGSSGQITVGRDWSLRSASSNPRYGYALRHGSVDLNVNYIRLVNGGQARLLFAGLRDLLRVRYPGVHPTGHLYITRASGRAGLTGLLTGPHWTGTATVFTDRSRKFAIEMIMLAPRGSAAAMLLPGMQVMQSLRMPGGPR